jgi:hypothetical protein
MTKAQQARKARLLPNGRPRWVRCYDNSDTPDATIDRYTVVFTGRYKHAMGEEHPYLAMSGAPFHPQGFCQHGSTPHACCDALDGKWPPAIGRLNHLGRRIRWENLPADCQRAAMEDYLDIWGIS